MSFSKLAFRRPTFTTTAFLVVSSLLLLCCPPATSYVDPASGKPNPARVLRGFEAPEQKWSPGHRGVDMALAVGSPVVAAEDGVVAFVGTVAGKPVVSITHADGVRTTYQPVHGAVKQGQEVREGQVIGRLGNPVDGYPGLHWGALIAKDTYIDPLTLLDMPVIRLKPL
ncbi:MULTISPECIES: M23 family metallopeptidase [Corynebacterium]|uniref:M23 family metallopeptidase n=1 Tax=Corynebacterium TaxID=1716 RepID=UPI00223BB781|nr:MULTISPECIES: M23 family metallopeptidase [Corynebacterium]MCT2187849.1 M23 family metallopeptidase [Corynebacterium kefirresidentii]MDU4568965.1 M23 family metallopeptidase [Corynebacterium sp.]MDU6012714.1 M23 family metallopeptidase [Corynebacterium sp.]MDV2414058.1 M23 family metallopeptidase [Corynebacterium kefirresidentii]